MYQSKEIRPGPSQASEINFFASIINEFKLMLLTVFYQKYHHGCLKSSDYTADLF